MLLIGGPFLDDTSAGLVFIGLGLLSLPVAMGVATLRYRLYDIDVVIDRALVYVPLIAIIGGLSTALIPVAHRVSRGLTGSESDATIVVTTLVIAALIAPVRKRLEGVVERRFRPRPAGGPAEELLEDPRFVALVERAAEDAVVRRLGGGS